MDLAMRGVILRIRPVHSPAMEKWPTQHHRIDRPNLPDVLPQGCR